MKIDLWWLHNFANILKAIEFYTLGELYGMYKLHLSKSGILKIIQHLSVEGVWFLFIAQPSPELFNFIFAWYTTMNFFFFACNQFFPMYKLYHKG